MTESENENDQNDHDHFDHNSVDAPHFTEHFTIDEIGKNCIIDHPNSGTQELSRWVGRVLASPEKTCRGALRTPKSGFDAASWARFRSGRSSVR